MLNRKGFTFIELMIVVVLIGIMAAIAIPNFIGMQDRAKEAKVKGIAHTVQLAMEDWAVRENGIYSALEKDILPLLPGGALMENPFTGLKTEPQWGKAAASPGQIGIEIVKDFYGTNVGYKITGFGKDYMVVELTSG